MLGERVADLARQFAPDGARKGKIWIARSPLRADRNPSFNVWVEGGARGAWKDYGSGEQGDAIDLIAACAIGGAYPFSREDRGKAIAWARDYLGLTDQAPAAAAARAQEAREKSAAREAEAAAARARKRLFAQGLWRASFPLLGSLAEVYLGFRAIDVRAIAHFGGSLRFTPWLRHPLEPHAGPAMLGRFSAPDGSFAALHCTFLRADGRGKADVDKPKIILGAYAGAAIRLTHGEGGLTPFEAAAKGISGVCALGEGIETMLSVAQARGEYRTWAAGSLDNIGNQTALPCVSAWLVCADNDLKKAAQEAFERGLAKLAAGGRPIEVSRPMAGNDFNDQHRGAA